MRVFPLGLLVFALGLGTAALLAGPGVGAGTAGTLSANVGPGFTISMSASSVPAGRYTITVDDQSSLHNFHLSGPGVDEATDIAGTGSASWSVVLQAGTYRFQCDAHAATMHGTLRVTGAQTTTQQTTAAPPQTTTEAATTTAAAPTTGATPTTPATTTSEGPAPAAPLAVRIGSVHATRTVVTVSVSSNEPGRAVVQLFAGSRRVARASGAAPGRIRLRPLHRLAPGRYTVRAAVAAGGSSATAAKRIRVS